MAVGSEKNTKATFIPVLRYRDAPAAIEWLCHAFGFEKHLVVPNDDGTVAHAQLSFGNGMIMLGSVMKNETEFGRLMRQPDEVGDAQTQSAYVVVADADAAYTRAKAGGAKVAMEIRTEGYGGRTALTARPISPAVGPTARPPKALSSSILWQMGSGCL
jgi:uncharacterized glyoxalase superfamily protein PhnB